MNKQKSKEIKITVEFLEHIKDKLESILFDESAYFDNIPENLQDSIRGEESENAIDVMQDVIDEIDNCISNLNEIV